MELPHIAYSLIVRTSSNRKELLVFRDAAAGGALSVPGASVALDEAACEAALRALAEVTGRHEVGAVRMVGADMWGEGEARRVRHVYEVELDESRARWQHVVTGERGDHGRVLDLFWVSIDQSTTLVDGLSAHLSALGRR